jgi:hypothetical protein
LLASALTTKQGEIMSYSGPCTRFVRVVAIAVLCASAAFAQTPPTLHIGDRAPAIEDVKWLKGTPARDFEKGKIYVIEFWASW